MHIRCGNSALMLNVETSLKLPSLVKLNLPRGQGSILRKLFSGILPLELEVGRYRNIDREIQYCNLCSEVTVEDEGHFLFESDSIDDCRSQSIIPL